MKGSVVWLGESECLLDSDDEEVSVSDPDLVRSMQAWVERALKQSEKQSPGSVTATALASVYDLAKARPHRERRNSPSLPHVEGKILPRRKVTNLPDVAFADVLEARRSVREFRRPTDADLLALLTHAGRSRFAWTTSSGSIVSSRPSPSAGALHSIEIVVAALNVQGLDPGLYWFDPNICRLTMLLSNRDQAQRTVARSQVALATHDPPPAVFHLVAQIRRTLTSYSGGMSLVLRDSGALMATICLVSTALGLAACPLGTGGDSPTLDALDGKYPEWAEVGAIAVGRPLQSTIGDSSG